jgi:hypothetical protein
MGYKSVLVSDAHSTFDNKMLNSEQIVKHHNALLGGRFAQLRAESEVQF